MIANLYHASATNIFTVAQNTLFRKILNAFISNICVIRELTKFLLNTIDEKRLLYIMFSFFFSYYDIIIELNTQNFFFT